MNANNAITLYAINGPANTKFIVVEVEDVVICGFVCCESVIYGVLKGGFEIYDIFIELYALLL